MVSAAEGGGFNTLLVQVRGRGEAFYRQRDRAARDRSGSRSPTSFDPLATAIELGAPRRACSVHAWVNVNLVASGTTLPRSREHVVFRHPEWLMVPNALAAALRTVDPRSPAYLGDARALDARRVGAASKGCTSRRSTDDAQDYTTSVVAELVDADTPSTASISTTSAIRRDDFDYSRAALAAFRAQHAAAAPAAERQRLDRARGQRSGRVGDAFSRKAGRRSAAIG